MSNSSCIVVADDNRDAADSLAQLIELMGYHEVAVYDGQQAVDACRKLHPALAILDVQMPVMDGCIAARRIRDAGTPPPWIASLTGLKLQEEPLKSGCDLFDVHLSKPLQLLELSRLLGDKLQAPH
jgi:CheY-like chemotaxis protein